MADNPLKITIELDSKGNGLKVTNAALNETTVIAGRANKSVGLLNDRFLTLGSQASIIATNLITLSNKAYNFLAAPIEAGIEYHSGLEQVQTALKATLSGYIDAATGAERISLANAAATAQTQALKFASAETGISFNDLSQAYKAFLPSALAAGMSMDKARAASVRLAQAAKIQGIEMGALRAGIDSVASGTVRVSSDFGRFLNGLGLTNEALKDAAANGTQAEFILEKLADIPAIAAQSNNTYKTSLDDLNKTIDELRAEVTKPIFETLIAAMQEANKFLIEHAEIIKQLPSVFG
ncbi:MAG: hypothetical protein LBP89_00085 [Helicobacteraceae bacterium]|jgi:hypothetical protein|nr:hypothetical protein [Helicobacteraceae bacterium]